MIYAVGDLHLDANRAKIPDVVDLRLATLDKVYTSAIESGVRHIVLLGDVFDSAYPDRDDQITLQTFLYQRGDVHWHVIVGNHDYADARNYSLKHLRWLARRKIINGTVYTKPSVVKLDGFRYFMCPHPYVQDQPEGCRYSFGHFGYNGAKGDNGFVLRTKHAPRGRWLLGDYHTPQRGKRYAYAGALCQVKAHEPKSKYYFAIDEDGYRLAEVVPELRLDRVTLRTREELAALRSDTYYSASFARELKLPPDWAVKYPNIVWHHTEPGASKRQRVLMQTVASEDPLEGLRPALLNTEGFSEADVARAGELLGREL